MWTTEQRKKYKSRMSLEERRTYNRERHRQRKLALIKMMGGECEKCGMNLLEYPMCADFDHLNPQDKVAEVGSLTAGKIDKLLEEWEKCQLLCANCHRIKTARE